MAGFTVTAKAKAQLNTGYLVREEVIDASVSASCKVGDVVRIANEGTSSAIIVPIVGTSLSASGSYSSADEAAAISAAAVSAGNLIIAQADQTMEYGHVPVEDRDYRYNPVVASTSSQKKIAVFRIRDISNIIVSHDVTSVNK